MSPSCDSLKCVQCNCTESMLWKSVGENQQICNDCFEQNKINTKTETETARQPKPEERKGKLRKSTRSTRYNGKNGNGNSVASGTNANSGKTTNVKSSGRGRRSLFRRPPMKAPSIPAQTQHVKSLFYKVSIRNDTIQNK